MHTLDEIMAQAPVADNANGATAVTLRSLNASVGAVAGLPSIWVAAWAGLALGLSRLRRRA
jgi:hypothetical protein